MWRPRTEDLQRRADALSKYEDNSQWGLNPRVYEQILAQPELAGRRPACDLFADERTTKVPGAFYSRYWNPTALGIDGFARSWAPPTSGPAPFLYINPPFDQIGKVLRKVWEDRPDCVLIVPVWPRSWRALLHGLPIQARWLLPHVEDLCIPGPMVPNAYMRRPMALRYRIEALYVAW